MSELCATCKTYVNNLARHTSGSGPCNAARARSFQQFNDKHKAQDKPPTDIFGNPLTRIEDDSDEEESESDLDEDFRDFNEDLGGVIQDNMDIDVGPSAPEDISESPENNTKDQEWHRHYEHYPPEHLAGAKVYLEKQPTLFETMAEQVAEIEEDGGCGPFKSKKDWEFARWVATNVGQGKTDELLKLETVSLVMSDFII